MVMKQSAGRRYVALTGFPFPLGPFFARRTVREEIVPGRIWGFEQEQNLFGITVNSRMVAVKLRNGGLWVYNPVAPTKELTELIDEVGTVKHIVLGTTQYEHKFTFAPFTRRYPDATVHAVPDQYSYPLDLPARFFGIAPTRQGPGGYLEDGKEYPDWSAEFDMRILRPSNRLAANYAAVEAAFVHRDTKTLLLTDALVNVPSQAPKIVDPSTLEYLGRRDSWVLRAAAFGNWRGQREVLDNAVTSSERQKGDLMQAGWMRNALLALTFGPSPESLVDPEPSFQRIADKWLVAPVCSNLVYASDEVRPALRDWVNQVAQLDFVRIAPSHFAVAKCSPAEFKRAFDPVFPDTRSSFPFFQQPQPSLDDGDVLLLKQIASVLKRFKII